MSNPQAKDKGIATEPLKRTKAPASRKKPNRYVQAFNTCKFMQTRWPHKQTLETLGLLEDVTAILKNMGFGQVLEMDYLVYPDEVAQLMGTFELKIKECYPPPSIEDVGCIKFKVDDVNYELSIKKLCEAYGFKQVYGGKVRTNRDSDIKFWNQIGYEPWKGSRCKAATISNPSVRYVHKVLANTIFARKEADKVKEDELHLLVNGLFPIFWHAFEEEEIACYEGLNLGILLARQVLHLKNEWVLNQNEKSKVYIGGFLTPILYMCDVPLGDPSTKSKAYIDIDNLQSLTFLDKRIVDKHVYKFVTEKGEDEWTELPNPMATDLQNLNTSYSNLRFIYGGAQEVEDEPSRKRAREATNASSSQALPLGSSRYYQPPFLGKTTSDGMRHALEGVSRNQRHGKWLSKSLHNVTKGLGKKIKKMAGQIKDLNALVGTYVLGRKSPPTNDDGSTNMEAALEEARRYSASFPLHAANVEQGEASRPSSHERRRRRIPTPSPPSSDNELYHYSDSNSE